MIALLTVTMITRCENILENLPLCLPEINSCTLLCDISVVASCSKVQVGWPDIISKNGQYQFICQNF